MDVRQKLIFSPSAHNDLLGIKHTNMTKSKRTRKGTGKHGGTVRKNTLTRLATCQAMKDLRDESRTGNLANAFQAATLLSNMISPGGNDDADIASTFFIYNDFHDKSALYRVRGDGWNWVKTYIFLKVEIQDEKLRNKARQLHSQLHTTEHWFNFLRCFHLNFGRRDVERWARLYFLNERTRTQKVFHHVEYDMYTMMWTVIRKVPVGFSVELEDVRYDVCDNVPERLAANGKRTKEGKHRKPNAVVPMLSVEDDYDLSYRPDEDVLFEHIVNDYDEQSSADDWRLQDSTDNERIAVSEQDKERIATDDDTLSVVSNLTLTTLDDLVQQPVLPDHCSSGEGDIIQDDTFSEKQDEEWIDQFSLASSFSMLEPPSVRDDNTENWEIVSEDSSIVLVENKSFCDAARSGEHAPSTITRPTIPSLNKHSTSKPRATLKKIIKDEESMDFDSDFIMKGVKNSRGGKASLQFKGNQRRTQL